MEYVVAIVSTVVLTYLGIRYRIRHNPLDDKDLRFNGAFFYYVDKDNSARDKEKRQ